MATDRLLRLRMVLEAADRVSKPLKDVGAGAGKAAEALARTRDRLKAIDRAQADINGFRQLKVGLRVTSDAMEQARAKASALGRQLAQTEAPTRALRSEFMRAKQEADQLSQRHEKESRALQAMRDRLAAAGIATRDLARHERDLRHEADRTADALERQTRRAEQAIARRARFAAGRENFDRVNNRATALAAGGASAIGTGMAAEAPVIASVKSAMEYESVMTQIALKSSLTRKEAHQLGEDMMRAAKAANQMPEAMQQGLDVLMSFGASLPDAKAMITPIGRAATAYKAEMADIAHAVFSVHDNLKVAANETGRVIEIMAQADNSGAFAMKDMAQFFPQLTAGYQGLGQTGVRAVADLAAALEIAQKGAGDASTAANNLSNVVQKIASPATIKAFKGFGVDLPNALKRAYAEGKTPIEAIAELTNKALKGDLGKIGFLFEDAQVQQGLRPLIQNMEEYRRIRESAFGSKGVADKSFANVMQDTDQRVKRLSISSEVMKTKIGDKLLPLVYQLSERIGDVADRVSDWADRHPKATKVMAVMAGVTGALFIGFGALGLVVAGAVAPFAALGAAAGILNIGMLPLTLTVLGVVAGLALLAGAAYLIYSNWDGIKAFFVNLWDGVKTKFSQVMAWFEGLKTRFTTFGSNLIHGMIDGFTGKLALLRKTISGAADAVANWFKAKLGIHSPSRVFHQLGGFVTQGLDNGLAKGSAGPLRRMERIAQALGEAGRVPDNATPLPRGLATIIRLPDAAQSPLADRAMVHQKRMGPLTARVGAALALGATMPAVASPVASTGAQRVGPSQSITGATYNITINAVPGMNEQQLVALLERKLREIETQKAAARRSAFADVQDWD